MIGQKQTIYKIKSGRAEMLQRPLQDIVLGTLDLE